MQPEGQPNQSRTDRRTFAYFGIASLGTVALGSAGLALSGADPGTWMRSPAAWLVGLGIAGAILAARRSEAIAKGAILLTPAALAATFLAAAQSGVHRWIDVGPLHINIASLMLPLTIVALATLNLAAPLFLGAVALIGLLLVAQPDASQATAFLLAAGLVLLRSRMSRATKAIGTLGIVALICAAWLRPDPLQRVREVEDIFALLADVTPALAIAAGLGLAISSLIPLRRAFRSDDRTGAAAMALALYSVTVALAPLAGAYPVPLVGLGMSFPVGFWLGVGLLCASARRR